MLQLFWKWLRRDRPASRLVAFRPTLETLEDRQVLSSSGLIASTYNAQNQPVVFAIRADRTLWEYDTNFGTPDHWMQVSPGTFESISACPTTTPDGPVVFGIVAGDHSLWENNPTFRPNAASLNDQWQKVSPASFDSISATIGTVNGYYQPAISQVEPIVYGIVSGDHSLWVNEKPPDFDPGTVSINGFWREVSPGDFTAIAAAYHEITPFSPRFGPPTVDPVVFGVVAGDHSLWENNPQFNPSAGDLNAQWVQIAAAPYGTLSAGEVPFHNPDTLAQEQLPVVYGIRLADQTLWEASGAGEVQVSAASWQTVSAPDPTSISAVDGSLWFTGQKAIVRISPGTFHAVSADLGIVFAEPTDHSLWEYNPAFNPEATDPNDHWALLSPAGVVF